MEKQWDLYKDKATKTSVVTLEKNNARKALTEYLRFLIEKYVTGNELVTDGDKETLGLTVKDIEPTSVHISDFAPELEVDNKKGGELILQLTYPENEKTRAIPKGANGFEVYQLWGEPVADERKFTFFGIASKNPYKMQFPELANVGKKVNFLVSFYNKKGDVGKWSNVATAIVI